jgi:hypothetical protein
VFQASLLAFGGFLAIFGISWFTKASPWSLPSCSHGILPQCLCLNIHFLRTLGDWLYWNRDHPNDLFFFFFLGGAVVWTQGLYLEPLHQPFSIMVLLCSKIGSHKLFA